MSDHEEKNNRTLILDNVIKNEDVCKDYKIIFQNDCKFIYQPITRSLENIHVKNLTKNHFDLVHDFIKYFGMYIVLRKINVIMEKNMKLTTGSRECMKTMRLEISEK